MINCVHAIQISHQGREIYLRKSFQYFGLIFFVLLVMVGCGTSQKNSTKNSSHPSSTAQPKNSKTSQTTKSSQKTKNKKAKSPTAKTGVTGLTNKQWEQQIAKTNFMGPSDGPYPTIHKGENIWIDANVSKERIYIKNGNKTIYTMLTSSGLDTNPNTSTPHGTFHVQAEKGKSFYSPSEKEGANYWTSWKNHGEFLFHTIPTDKNGNYIKSEAEKLGQKASHGCFRLPIRDAKWIYQNIPEGTKVVIHA